MIRLTLLMFVVPLIFLFSSCNDPCSIVTTSSESPLLGSWEWLESVSEGIPSTPSSVGYTLQLQFGRDSMAYWFKDTFQLSLASMYKVYRDKLYPNADSTDLLAFVEQSGNVNLFTMEFITGDTLFLRPALGSDQGHQKYSKR